MFKFIVRFLKILVILSIIGISFKLIDMIIHKDNYKEKEQISIEQVAMENVLDRLSEEDIIKNDDTDEDEQEADVEKSEEKIEVVKKENKNTELKEETSQEIKTSDKKDSIETSQVDVIENETDEIKETEEEQEIKEEIIEGQNIIKEEYKENTQMINKIKDIINNNLSDDMKEYGYSIVIDSSIPELTNEFTFTEQRVINKLKYKSGIIKIYARDYYYNENYVSTQCFII